MLYTILYSVVADHMPWSSEQFSHPFEPTKLDPFDPHT